MRLKQILFFFFSFFRESDDDWNSNDIVIEGSQKFVFPLIKENWKAGITTFARYT